MRPALAIFALAALPLSAQDLLPPEVLMLSRIRAHVRETLAHLPDCTCVETVSRFSKVPGKDFRPLDTVVFQILFTGDKELFTWPGDTKWEDNPFAFVHSGMLGNGLFALHLGSIFNGTQALIKYHGMEEPGGRAAARYDFSMSRMMSGYTIKRLNASAVVATRGSFWADPDTYDLRRVEFHAEEIPAELLYSEINTAIDYERVRVGDHEVLLPQTADLSTVDYDGSGNRDLIEFTHCQAFHTETTVSFEPPPVSDSEAAPAAPKPVSVSGVASAALKSVTPSEAASPTLKPVSEAALPPDLRVTVALTAPVTDRAAVGALVEGKVAANVTLKGKVLVPAGSRVEGRIRHLEPAPDRANSFVLAIEFTRIETLTQIVRFYASIEQSDNLDGVDSPDTVPPTSRFNHPIMSVPRADDVLIHQIPGVGTFFINHPHFTLPAGFKTVWKTLPYRRSATP